MINDRYHLTIPVRYTVEQRIDHIYAVDRLTGDAQAVDPLKIGAVYEQLRRYNEAWRNDCALWMQQECEPWEVA